MDNIELQTNEKGRGAFYISDEGERVGEMEISIANKHLTVYHTEVIPKAEGKGFAKKLFTAMVEYVRGHNLKVIPLCPYVLASFKRHPEEYADIWEKVI